MGGGRVMGDGKGKGKVRARVMICIGLMLGVCCFVLGQSLTAS